MYPQVRKSGQENNVAQGQGKVREFHSRSGKKYVFQRSTLVGFYGHEM